LPDVITVVSKNPKLLETKKLPDSSKPTNAVEEETNYSINIQADFIKAAILKKRNQIDKSFVITLKPNFTYYTTRYRILLSDLFHFPLAVH